MPRSLVLRAWISARDTGRVMARCLVHAGPDCHRAPRALRPVDVASLDPDARSCLITGLGRRACCAYCWPADLDRLAATIGDRDAAAASAAAAPRPAHGRNDALPPFGGPGPRLQLGAIDRGWIAADETLDRHAIHAIPDCTHAARAVSALHEVRVDLPKELGGRAGWWHPPPAHAWVPGVGRRRLCRECWPRALAAAGACADAAWPRRRRRAAGSDASGRPPAAQPPTADAAPVRATQRPRP